MSYEDMDAGQLRDEREAWRVQICKLAREYRQAVAAENVVWAEGIGIGLDQALAVEHRLDRLLKVSVAA